MKSALVSIILAVFTFIPLQAEIRNVNPTTGVPLKQAIRDALTVAERDADWTVMLGDGVSMSPYYAEGSVLLVDRAPYHKLKEGMMVIFRDNSGDLVGHWLVRQEGNGWVTQGVNNASIDPELMTSSNFVGVIFGVLNSRGADAQGLAYAQQMQLPSVIGKTVR